MNFRFAFECFYVYTFSKKKLKKVKEILTKLSKEYFSKFLFFSLLFYFLFSILFCFKIQSNKIQNRTSTIQLTD